MTIIKNKLAYFWILLVVCSLPLWTGLRNIAAGPESETDEIVNVKTAWSVDRARPGDTVLLAIIVNIKEGFHINADARQIHQLKDFKPYPTSVRIVEMTEGLTSEAPRYPRAIPVKVDYAGGDLMSFKGRSIIFLPMKLDDSINPASLGLKIGLEYQACAATYCLFPQKTTFEEKLVVVKRGENVTKINKEIFAGYPPVPAAETSSGVHFDLFGLTFWIDVSSGLGWILLLFTAAFGGFLLNFTPCVLPLIPIKIISLSHAAENQKKCFALGVSMFLGVLVFWLGLGTMIALVSDFTATNQLFQYPPFTILVGVIIGTMAVGMFGFFTVRLPNFIYMINPEQDTLRGSFGLGILAAILSTPCTAPFMGAAAAWASTQEALTTLSTFAAIGTGMALPYLVLSASPKLVEKMPKTGPASVLIKQIMGLFMLAAATYFIGVGLSAFFSSPSNPPGNLYWWPAMFFCAAAGAWLIYRTFQISSSKKVVTVFGAMGIIIIGLSTWGGELLTDRGPIPWVYYTPQKFEKATNDRKVVVMVFTAEWCLNCKALEQGVLKNTKIVELFTRDDIIPIKVDITGNNPDGKAKLKEVGNLTIPLLVIYSPKGNQVFKSDFYTVEQVYNAVTGALEKAGSST